MEERWKLEVDGGVVLQMGKRDGAASIGISLVSADINQIQHQQHQKYVFHFAEYIICSVLIFVYTFR